MAKNYKEKDEVADDEASKQEDLLNKSPLLRRGEKIWIKILFLVVGDKVMVMVLVLALLQRDLWEITIEIAGMCIHT